MSSQHDFISKKIIPIINSNKIKTILDYGCGEGEVLKQLSLHDNQLSLYGTDYLSSYPAETRLQSTDKITFVDKKSPEYEKLLIKKFDLIISTFALHHYKLPISELQTLEGLLSTDGYLFIADMNSLNNSNAKNVKHLCSFIGEAFAFNLGKYHRHHYSLEEALDCIKGTNLKIEIAEDHIIEKTSEELQKEAKETIDHNNNHILKALSKLPNPMLENYFENSFKNLNQLLEQHYIDYSSFFIIVAKK